MNFLISDSLGLSCSHDGELLADETNCRKYFKCSNGRPATQSCPGTLIFDTKLRICNWPDSTVCVQELVKPKKTVKIDEDDEKRRNRDREEVSSLFHVKERDFSSLRDRHRRLRERIRQRDKEEATTTTTTTRRPSNPFLRDEDEDSDGDSGRSTSSFRSRGALLHRNRQDTLDKKREREELIERLNRNRFETVGGSQPVTAPSRSRTPPPRQSSADLEKQELLDKLNQFEREREELIRKLTELESGDGDDLSRQRPESGFRQRPQSDFSDRDDISRQRQRPQSDFGRRPVEPTTPKPRKTLKPIVCRENNELHANPKSCRKYFKCENGLPSLQSCPANLIFDAGINVCNWPDATECIEDPDAILPTLGSSDVHPPSASIFRRPPPPSSFAGDNDFFDPAPPPPAPQPEGIPPTLEEALAQEQRITDEYPYFRFVSFGEKGGKHLK